MKNTLSKKEVALIKGIMEYYPKLDNQTILNRFSVMERTINAGRISEIRTGKKHKDVQVAPKKEVKDFVDGRTNVYYYLQQLTLAGQDMFLFGDIKYSPSNMSVKTPENENVEYKEIFSGREICSYLKILVAMANTGAKNGKIVFGVTDKSRKIIGCKSNINLKRVCEICREHFQPYLKIYEAASIAGEQTVLCLGFNDEGLPPLPIMCKRDHNDATGTTVIADGQIYYRYNEHTKPILFAELERLINRRIMGN